MPGALFAPWKKRRRPLAASLPTPPAAPDTPSAPSPADTATAYYTRLSWVSARATKADVYLDTVNPPTTIVVPKLQASSYVPTLQPSTTYYWKIVASNEGGSATGPVWAFTTPAATAVIFSLAGSIVTSRALRDSLSIREVLGASPNTASLSFKTSPPTAGQAIRIGVGTLDDDDLAFGGEIQATDQTYQGRPTTGTRYPVSLIDHTFRINKRRPFGTWTNTSASIIARYLVATFAPGFTAIHVQDGLPAVSIRFDGQQDFMTCLKALANAISDLTTVGKSKVDYAKDVWLYLTYDGAQPDPIDTLHPPLDGPTPITSTIDHSQLRTRAYGKGHGESVPTDVAAGEPIVPIADAVMFNPAGGQAIAGVESDAAQTEILTYAGVQLGGGGAFVGPGASPSVAPVVTRIAGTGIDAGFHSYAYTDVTALGESLPSPLGVGLENKLADNPTTAPTLISDGPNAGGVGKTVGNTYDYCYTYTITASPTLAGAVDETMDSPFMANVAQADNHGGGTASFITYKVPYSTNANLTNILMYRRNTTGGGTFHRFAIIENISAGGLSPEQTDANSDASIAGNPGRPNVNTAACQQNIISSVALGASGTTSRKVYRTPKDSSQLKLLTTFANNTSTGPYTDSTADAALGANAPSTDTSGLTQGTGQVLAGSVSLPTSGAGPFAVNGGWATLSGSQTVRYTGITGNTLTGIPASGPGAIQTTVLYGSQALPSPALTGINQWNGLVHAMASGSPVKLWVQRDDLTAQAALGASELDDDGRPTDGIREYTITEERSGEDRLIALCDADLAIFSRPIVTADYYTRDPESKAGRTVHIDLPATGTWLGLAGDFTIQSVDLTFDAPSLYPLRHVTATSVAFTLRDLLRRVALAA